MTECIGGPVEEFAERYLNGSLSEAEAESFENHYFACDACHDMLLAMKDIQAGLETAPRSYASSEDAAVRTEGLPASGPAQPLRIVSRRDVKPVQLGTPKKFVAWGSIAAAILVAVVLTAVGLHRHSIQGQDAHSTPHAPQTGQPAQGVAPVAGASTDGKSAAKATESGAGEDRNVQLAELADMRMPDFQAPLLRGSEPSDAVQTAFESAMKSYAQGDCAAALRKFARVPDGSQHGVASRLYGGLCHFKAHELSQAQSSLERVIAAGDTPQLETAEYYLAQTMLLSADASNARVWLRRTVALHGDYQKRAQDQLTRLVHIAQQPWSIP